VYCTTGHLAKMFAPECTPLGDDIGPNSAGEAERLRVRNEELEHEVSWLKRENAALRCELDELRARALPPADDGLDIPECLRRRPA
jgi:Basic region leucine zipper